MISRNFITEKNGWSISRFFIAGIHVLMGIYNLQNLLTHYNINLLSNKLNIKNGNQGRSFYYTRARPRETHRRAHAIYTLYQ